MADRSAPPPLTTTELLTAQFYDWERRGRGWQVYDAPVVLEPPYTPFHRYAVLGARPPDDGRKETFASSIASLVKSLVTGVQAPAPRTPAHEHEAAAYDNDCGAARAELAVVLPADEEVSREAAEQLLLSLSTCPSPVSFEIIGTSETISVQLSCRETETVPIAQQITAYFPEAVVDERHGFLAQAWQQAGWHEQLIVDFGLSNEFMRPVRTFRNFGVDPLIAIGGALSDVCSGEVAVLQVLFQSCRHSWAESIMRAVTDGTGESFFADAPEMVKLAKEKIARPLSAVVIRAGAKSAKDGRAQTLVRGLFRALGQLAEPASNELIPLTNDAYDDEDHERDLLNRSQCCS